MHLHHQDTKTPRHQGLQGTKKCFPQILGALVVGQLHDPGSTQNVFERVQWNKEINF
jgi:hypothetical protein